MNHVLEVIANGDPAGGSSVVLALARGLVQRGLRVTIASHRGSYIIHESRRSGISALELDFSKRLSSVNLALKLRRYINESDIDVIHAHGSRAALPLSLLAGSYPCSYVYSVHGFHYASKPPGMRYLARQAERLCIRRASTSVFVCQHDKNIALADGLLQSGQSSVIIYNGADPTVRTFSTDSFRQFDIAVLGRLHPQKNPLILPEILLALRPARPIMAIIGGGDLEMPLRARVSEAGLESQVKFLGNQPQAQAVALLSEAKVMLLPSISEGFPVAVLEAMHNGVPVVASAVGGIGEQIINGQTGFLVEKGNIQGFAQCIQQLLESPDRRQRMAAAAFEVATRHFTVQQNLEEHITLYDSQLRRQSNPVMQTEAA